MSNFQGFDRPESNWFKVPNDFWDFAELTVHERILLLYILRHTWGFSEYDEPKKITVDEFMNGRKRSDGTRIDKGCQMSRGAVSQGLTRLGNLGYLEITTDDSDAARVKKYYRLKMSDTVIQGSPNEHRVHQMNTEFTIRTQSSFNEPEQRKKPEQDTLIDTKEIMPYFFAALNHHEQIYSDNKRLDPLVFQMEYNLLFKAWLDVLALNGMPRGNDYKALWERERDGAVTLAKQRITPDELKRYVSEDLLADKKGGNWYKVNAKIPKLETVATHIGVWLKEQAESAQTESDNDVPATPLKPKFTREQMRKAMGLESKDGE